ncbi:MAG: DUF4065 domain-containing protein [Bacillota bacterium]|nr:DUF4065 domain-containing protein [Bacillota bacterium]MDW7682662.1 DUF4065 domain-containing protein [Bacillota bacterium]
MVWENGQVSYCCYCDDDFPVEIKEVSQENVIKGQKVEAVVRHAYCTNCTQEVYIAEINDENLRIIDEKYRLDHNIVLVSEIEELLEKYNIGAKPMSLLLGWGEATLPRYLKGQIPNREHSDRLKKIRNPYCLLEIFQQNKGVLSDVAARKVEGALSVLLELAAGQENIIPERGLVEFFQDHPNSFNGYTQFNLKKTIHAILYFLSNYGPSYKTKMNKLLWYADMLSFKRNSQAITGLRYVRHHYGPVPKRYEYLYGSLSDVYITLDESNFGTRLLPLKEYSGDVFSPAELQVLQDIGDRFQDMNAEGLSEYSHGEYAYLETNRKELISFEYANRLRFN